MGLTSFNWEAAGQEVTPSTVEPAVNISVSLRKSLVDKSTRYSTTTGLQSDSEVASRPARRCLWQGMRNTPSCSRLKPLQYVTQRHSPPRSTSVWFVVFVSERLQIPGIYMCMYIYPWPLTCSFFHHVLFFMLHMHASVMMAGLCYGWDVTVGTLCGSLKTSCWLWEGIRSQTRFAVALV